MKHICGTNQWTGLKVDMKELNKVSNDVSNYVFWRSKELKKHGDKLCAKENFGKKLWIDYKI